MEYKLIMLKNLFQIWVANLIMYSLQKSSVVFITWNETD